MTTLAEDTARSYDLGDHNDIPVIASEIIYEGSAVGIVDATGHARPLATLDTFAGFCQAKVDNSAGAAAAKNVKVNRRGQVQLSVTGAVITDVGQPVYATDDNAFTFIPTSAVFIGFVKRYVSAGVAVVEFDASVLKDPYLAYGSPENYETISANKTLDIEDVGKVFFVDTDAKVVTLAAVATLLEATIVNIGAFGAVLLTVTPNAADMIHAPDLAGVNAKTHLNTKATARRGDMVKLSSGSGNADGHVVTDQVGIWAQGA
jgi:hypothetical protein